MMIKELFSDTLNDKQELKNMPPLDLDLVEALNARFPEQSADMNWSDKEVWYKSGQRSVVKFLIEVLKEQEDK
jgi:hypothetical protein